MRLTKAQAQAVEARGNILVTAGAGTGKTRTLVERCLACLLDEKDAASIDEILMVTFTEAAAAEMRQRIRERLEQQQAAAPRSARWREQLALFECAHIGTLHSFCLQLVRQHFHELDLDPQLAVLAQEEAQALAEQTLDEVLQRHYAGDDAAAKSVQSLIRVQGGGRDLPVRDWIFQLHNYSQTLPEPEAWWNRQLTYFADREPNLWREWLREAITDLSQQWLPGLVPGETLNPVAAQCRRALVNLAKAGSEAELIEAFAQLSTAPALCVRGKTASWVEPLSELFSEASFLASLLAPEGEAHPLTQDWAWVRGAMTTLLELGREFSQAFANAKRELAVLDFHDLEQFCLRLLWDSAQGQPSAVALTWRQKLRFVFVDEYQDINAAQDKIIECLSRDLSNANRFLVGDVKQSIYRFRLANPAIFQAYAARWLPPEGTVIDLVENFRAKEGVLRWINSFFDILLTPDLGGVDYRSTSRLRFGAPEERAPLRAEANGLAPVELHLLTKAAAAEAASSEDASEGPTNPPEDLLDTEKEARFIATRLQELHSERYPVWDDTLGAFRPVTWSDMAILLRAPATKAEKYAKEFARLKIPLESARPGFYKCQEALDLISLLQLLDNPLQDLPALAVLRSPVVGLSTSELAQIRIALPKGPFWTALNRWFGGVASSGNAGLSPQQADKAPDATHPRLDTRIKVGNFLARFSRWRRMARQFSLSQLLESVLVETQYNSWLLAQPDGLRRRANVQALLDVARQFDKFQRQSLFRFLRYIDAQKSGQSEPETPSVPSEESVRLMSIHQSKGLEFPVVVLADLGKKFNTAELRAEVILDEVYGLCPLVKPPDRGTRYPSLAHWLGARRQLKQTLAEELRLFYVGTTRARDLLILCGTTTESALEKNWCGAPALRAQGRHARSYLDWLAQWFRNTVEPVAQMPEQGRSDLIRWFCHGPAALSHRMNQAPLSAQPAAGGEEPAPAALQELKKRLAWDYPFAAATRLPAKTSVTALRRLADANLEEAVPLGGARASVKAIQGSRAPALMDPAEVGQAHHLFLQWVSLDGPGDPAWLRKEAQRLIEVGRISHEQGQVLDFLRLGDFWTSELGVDIRGCPDYVHRELSFTARFKPGELPQFQNETPMENTMDDDFLLVQGVADLVVLAPEEIWLVDFKTDRLEEAELKARVAHYRPQVELYALALSRIYRRPVTKAWLHFLGLSRSVRVAVDC